MKAVYWLGAAVLGALALGCSSDELAQAPTTEPSSTRPSAVTPEPELTAVVTSSACDGPSAMGRDAFPRDAVGPLVVYSAARSSEVGSLGPCLADNDLGSRLYVYDLGARRLLYAWSAPGRIHVGGPRIFAVSDDAVWSYALDGTDGEELFQGDAGTQIEAAVAHPSGAMIALAYFQEGLEYHADYTMEVVTSDQVLLHVPQSDVDHRLNGYITPTEWSADSQTLAFTAHAHKEHVGLEGTVTLAGEFTFDDEVSVDADPDPLRRRPTLVRPLGTACFFEGLVQALELVDAETGARIAYLEEEVPALQSSDWAPDGSGLLYRRLVGLDAGTRRLLADDALCDTERLYELLTDSSEWFVLPTDGGDPRPVASRAAALERWYGDRAVTFVCEGEVQPGQARAGWRNPRFEDPACDRAQWKLRIGGVPIAEGVDLAVYGFVDRSPTARVPRRSSNESPEARRRRQRSRRR